MAKIVIYGAPWCGECKRIWLPPSIEKDETGFIITQSNLETSLSGVFAAGDARKGSTKQAASAAGEGATAAIMIRDYLHSR